VERGWSVNRIATELGCGHSTVARRLDDFGLSTTSVRKFPIEERDLRRMVDAGWTQNQMAEHYSCRTNTIFKRLRRYGLRTLRSSRRIND
jgi:transcriptional regulator of acetoin/glycerol metabolism